MRAKRAMRAEARVARAAAFGRHGAQALARLDLATAAAMIAVQVPSRRGVLAAYLAMRDEIDPMPVAQALVELGWQLALPVVQGRAVPLVFRVWAPGGPTVAASFGTREPPPDNAEVEPDVLLVPLLAYDEGGYRLGYGGGYYDRTLQVLRARRNVLAIGVAYDEQKVPAIPRKDYDQRLDGVLTPSGLTCLPQHS